MRSLASLLFLFLISTQTSAVETESGMPATLNCIRILTTLSPQSELVLMQSRLTAPLVDAFVNPRGMIEIHSGENQVDWTTIEFLNARKPEFQARQNAKNLAPAAFSATFNLAADLDTSTGVINVIDKRNDSVVFVIEIKSLLKEFSGLDLPPHGFRPRISFSADERFLLFVSTYNVQAFDLFEGKWAHGFQSGGGQIQSADFVSEDVVFAIVNNQMLLIHSDHIEALAPFPKNQTHLRSAIFRLPNGETRIALNTMTDEGQRVGVIVYQLTLKGLQKINEFHPMHQAPIDWMKSGPLEGIFVYSSVTRALSYIPQRALTMMPYPQ